MTREFFTAISIVGGIKLDFSVHPSCARQSFIKINPDFCVDSDREVSNDFCVDFFLSEECQLERKIEKIIFFDGRTIIKELPEGKLIVCLSESKKNVLWNIFINFEFSRFRYDLSVEALETNDFFQLGCNRFLLQHTFINHHGLIIHAAGGSINGKGMVFPAVSGTGKSTLSHLLLPHPENQLFSEERIIMRRLDDGWHLWGTPWKGTGVIARNESAPLNALVFLSQAPETTISKLPPSVTLRRLLETVSIPWYSQEWTEKGLAVCESLLKTIPAYELAFRPDQTAVQAVAELAASLD